MSPAAAPGSATNQPPFRSYHGQPVIKEPVWTWEIPLYFFTGGLAGASAGLAYLAELRGNDVLARRAWTAGLAGLTISPALLTSDLGQPRRFINMLRMFKVTSPMSVGSWILSGSGVSTGVAAVNAWTGLFPRAGAVARPAAAAFGLPLSTYTAALIANTAVPVWHGARQTLPFVFASGASLSAAAAAAALTPPTDAAAARRLAVGSAAAELALSQLMEKQLGELAAPYKQGAPRRLKWISRACLLTGSALMATHGSSSAATARAGALLLGAGALSTRFSIFKAGFRSAADPRQVIGPQRAAIDRGERAGAARTEPRVSTPDPRRGSPATSLASSVD